MLIVLRRRYGVCCLWTRSFDDLVRCFDSRYVQVQTIGFTDNFAEESRQLDALLGDAAA